MRNHLRLTIIAVAAIAGLALLSFAAMSIAQQRAARASAPTYRAPRLDGHPDLNGIWQAFVTANMDLQDHEAQPGPHPELMGAYGAEPAGQSIVEGGEIPYQPWALAKKKENFDKRMTVDVSNDKKWHDARRSGTEVLHARRAARDLHAVSVSDRPGHRARTSSSPTRSRARRAPSA